jgi:hypothetical protein
MYSLVYYWDTNYGSYFSNYPSYLIFLILDCEAIGTAATPGLLYQLRVIVKMIVEEMECRLAGETEFSEKTCPSATFLHHKIPHDQTRF